MSGRALYEITTDLRLLLLQVEENDGELTPEIMEAIEAAGLELEGKVDQCMAFRQDVLGDAEKFAAEIERLQGNKKSLMRTADSLREYVRSCMEIADVKSLSTPRFKKIWRQNNPERVAIDDEEKVPDEYRLATVTVALVELPANLVNQATISLDTQAIKTDLQTGLEVGGAHLEQGEHLRAK